MTSGVDSCREWTQEEAKQLRPALKLGAKHLLGSGNRDEAAILHKIDATLRAMLETEAAQRAALQRIFVEAKDAMR